MNDKKISLLMRRLKARFQLSCLSNKRMKDIDFVRDTSEKLFEKRCKGFAISDDDAILLLLTKEYEKKFNIYAQKGAHGSYFTSVVAKNGNLNQVSLLLNNRTIHRDAISEYIARFSEDELVLLFEQYNALTVQTFSMLIEKGYEKPLVTLLKNNADIDFWVAIFEDILFKSNFNEAKRVYISEYKKWYYSARMYIYDNYPYETIAEALKCDVSTQELLHLINHKNDKVKELAIDKFRCKYRMLDDYSSFISRVLDLENIELIKKLLTKKDITLDRMNEIKLAKKGVEELVLTYIDNRQQYIADIADDALLMFYKDYSQAVKDKITILFGLPYPIERKMIKDGLFEDIKDYIATTVLYPTNELLLISCKNKRLVKNYILNHGKLSNIAETELMKSNEKELIDIYLNLLFSSKLNPANTNALCDYAAYYFVLNGEKQSVLSYLKKMTSDIPSLVQQAILIRGDKDIIEAISDFSCLSFVEVAKTASLEQLKKLFGLVKFPTEAEIELIKRNDTSILKAYISVADFSADAEWLLVDQPIDANMLEVLKYYIEQYPLYDKTEVLLIEKDIKPILNLYIEKYPLCKDAEDTLCSKL